jgi:hypothetical protein
MVPVDDFTRLVVFQSCNSRAANDHCVARGALAYLD